MQVSHAPGGAPHGVHMHDRFSMKMIGSARQKPRGAN